MAVFAGIMISAAGQLAGGAAAQALFPEPPPYAPDTSIPGISSATIKKKSKGNAAVTVPQVNIAQSLQWYKDAATAQTQYLNQGYNMYSTALDTGFAQYKENVGKGASDIRAGYERAETTLKPMSMAATNAMNEQLRFLGMNPSQMSTGLSSDLGQIADAAGVLNEGAGTKLKDLQSRMSVAEGYTDERQRAQAKQQIMSELYGAMDLIPDNKAFQQEIRSLSNEFEASYDIKPTAGAYTGDEVMNKISSTPGFQYQFEQGQKAIERQQAAVGMLGSGNTLLAAQEKGQGLAQSYFNTHMDRLGQIVQEGSGATQQLASNQVNEGKDYAAMWQGVGQTAMQVEQSRGQAGMDTQAAIGQTQAEYRYKSGQLYADAAMFNATMQYNGIQADKGREVQMAQSAMAAAPQVQANNLNQAKFNYAVAGDQQQGQAFYGGGSPGSTYQSYGMSFPNYTRV